MSSPSRGNLVLDVRAFDPSLRRSMIFAVVDQCVVSTAATISFSCRITIPVVSDTRSSSPFPR